MRRGYGFRIAAVLLAGVLLATSVGCVEWLAVTNVVSFGAGWLLRDVTFPTTVQRECYQNGVLVDCATLPVQTTP